MVIIGGMGTAISGLAVTIYRMMLAQIAKLEATIKEQHERELKQIALQAETTETLRKVVDVGIDRLRSAPPEDAS